MKLPPRPNQFLAIGTVAMMALSSLIVSPRFVFAADPKPTTEEQIATVSRQAKEFAGRCQFTVTGPTPASFQLQPEPILRWSNPTAGAVYGDIFLYTHRGRPAAAVSYYRWLTPNWGSTIEVCALHPEPFVGQVDGVRFWKPQSSALKFTSLSDAETPAANPGTRLVQLRRMANAFRAQLVDTRAGDTGVQRTLRRLTQPVYRYASPTADAEYIDGAVFAFVEGTDPELLLLIEAVPAQSKSVWQFGIARMNRDQIQVLRGDTVVWEADYLADPNEQTEASYTTFSAEKPLKPIPNPSGTKN